MPVHRAASRCVAVGAWRRIACGTSARRMAFPCGRSRRPQLRPAAVQGAGRSGEGHGRRLADDRIAVAATVALECAAGTGAATFAAAGFHATEVHAHSRSPGFSDIGLRFGWRFLLACKPQRGRSDISPSISHLAGRPHGTCLLPDHMTPFHTFLSHLRSPLIRILHVDSEYCAEGEADQESGGDHAATSKPGTVSMNR